MATAAIVRFGRTGVAVSQIECATFKKAAEVACAISVVFGYEATHHSFLVSPERPRMGWSNGEFFVDAFMAPV